MRFFLALACLPLAACATSARPDHVWLIGNWCPDEPTTNYGGVEVGQWPTQFAADGTYDTFEGEGIWEVRGRTLIRRRDIGPGIMRTNDRVERLGPDRMAWTWQTGQRELWRRCPADRR